MYDLNRLDDLHYQKVLSRLAKELDTARWALYEIKRNSEKGKIIKVIIYLVSSESKLDKGTWHFDIRWLTDQLVNTGFDKKEVSQTIIRLFGTKTTH